MRRGFLVILLIGLVSGDLSGHTGQTPAGQQPPKNFKVFNDPLGRFTLDYPKDWQVVAGARNLLLTLAQKDLKAVVVVEQQVMLNAASEVTDLLMSLEVEELKSRQPGAENIKPSVAPGRPKVLVIDYARTGSAGPERLRQYSIQEGTLLLRITCVAPARDFDRHQEIFSAVAGSVRVSPRAAGGGVLE